MTQGVGTIRYMAPEVYQDSPYTHKVDIWSFAFVCFFIWEGVPPMLAGGTSASGYQLGLVGGHRPPFRATPPAIRSVIQRAWDIDPRLRPDALQCLASLPKPRRWVVRG